MTILLEERIDEKRGGERNRRSNIAAKVIILKDSTNAEIKHKKREYTPKKTDDLDSEDSGVYQRSRPRMMGTDGANGGYVTEFHQKPLDIPKLFSYIGSGVREQYEEAERGDSQRFKQIGTPLTPMQGGELIAGILREAVAKTNEHMPPETKERFLLWLQMPDGKVWLHHYENTSTVRTRNYNFGSLN